MSDDTDGNFLPNPNYLVATAVQDAFPGRNPVFLPKVIDGLAETFTVIHFGAVVDGIQYFAGLYGEHDLDDVRDSNGATINPMNLEPIVIGVQLVDGRLTVTDALSAKYGTSTIATAKVLMVVQYGEVRTTGQQPPTDPDSKCWTVQLEQYSDPVTCYCLATLSHDDDTYSFYIGDGVKNGIIEHFLLVVEIIGGESLAVNLKNDELWNALFSALLDDYGIDTYDGSDIEDPDGEAKEGDGANGANGANGATDFSIW